MSEIKKQASNIDEQGNVLYLDKERLKRKEVPFPPYKNKPNGLGIFNFLKEHLIYMSDKRWPLALKLYRMFIKFSVWMKEGGLKAKIYKKGMKPGLWVEAEVIGDKCQEMLDFYDDDCFLQRNGKPVHVWNRYFLDYRNGKVRTYMTEVFRQMIEDYGAKYIKIDYNQDCGIGTDWKAFFWAAVWSYPFGNDCKTPEEVTDNRITMNMINTFPGRLYLSSRLWMLDEHQLSLVKEGVDYYNTLSEMKKRAVPYFPNGFTRFGDKGVCLGLKD